MKLLIPNTFIFLCILSLVSMGCNDEALMGVDDESNEHDNGNDNDNDDDDDGDDDDDDDDNDDNDNDNDNDTGEDDDTGEDNNDDQIDDCIDNDTDWWCEEFDCNDNDPDVHPNQEEDTENGIDDDCDGFTDEVDGDTEPDTYTDSEDCSEWDVGINIVPTRVMILVDSSTSMIEGSPTKWTQAQGAVTSIVTAFDEFIQFGLDQFPLYIPFELGQACYVDDPPIIDAEPNMAASIIASINGSEPNGLTPLYQAVEKYSDPGYAPKFMADGADKYLIIVADGLDTCGFGSSGSTQVTHQDMTDVTTEALNNGIKTMVIGFGNGLDADPEQLNAIAEAGGTPFTEYFKASDQQELEDALSGIIDFTLDCVYDVDPQDQDAVDMDTVTFYFDGEEIPWDPDCLADTGWTWLGSDYAQVKFCEEACNKLKAGAVANISATFDCPPDPIIITKEK